MEILAALIFVIAAAVLFAAMFFRRKRGDAQKIRFFVENGIVPAENYENELPAFECENLICRKLNVKRSYATEIVVHWCEYRVFTHQYAAPSNRLFINYSIISFPGETATAEFTEKISTMVGRRAERFKGNMLQRIRKDSERPTDVKLLPNGDLATFWTSRNNLEDLEYKFRWIKEILG